MDISIVVATDLSGGIGKNGKMPWEKIPADMSHFVRLTKGRHVLMGRKTLDSLGKPLPDRENIILSRDPRFEAPGCLIARSIGEVWGFVSGRDTELVVIGGKDIFVLFLPITSRVHITTVCDYFECDTYFPVDELENSPWIKTDSRYEAPSEKSNFPLVFETFERKGS